MAKFELWERETLNQFAAEATRKLLENKAEIERLRAALRRHIRIYRVADETYDPEAETDRLMALALQMPNG